ncbi:MAG: hypothetical protein H0T85_07050 [Geodermatophilaceae bacterium]|nr:hypothetical protein [Geodermatophilaceae bacterium]
MDCFYRYLQWLWAVREITRNVASLVLVDDHDVFQGNIWGEGGLPAAGGNQYLGGYVNSPDWVNLVQRVQCGHNPDPVDPEPVAQGITVYFTRFDYGGVTFALLEDRKFKTSPDGIPGVPVSDYQFLGPRQEAMLDSLSGSTNPVVVVTQTMFACVETDRDGVVAGTEDSGGWPKPGRDRALSSIKAAGGVLLSGDTHLAALVRHGIDDAVDGPVQFCGPAVSASYQRWFQPADPLPDPTAEPFTGRAVNGLGNDYRVLAVANPRRTQGQVLADAGAPASDSGMTRARATACRSSIRPSVRSVSPRGHGTPTLTARTHYHCPAGRTHCPSTWSEPPSVRLAPDGADWRRSRRDDAGAGGAAPTSESSDLPGRRGGGHGRDRGRGSAGAVGDPGRGNAQSAAARREGLLDGSGVLAEPHPGLGPAR